MRRAFAASMVGCLLLLAADAGAGFYSVRLNGAQVVPATSSRGTAVGMVHVSDVPSANGAFAVDVKVNFNGLTAGATACRLYMPGGVGLNAPAVVQLTVTPPLSTSGVCSGSGAINATHQQQMTSGLSYIVVESTAFPQGEIRDQITAPGTAVPALSTHAITILAAALLAIGATWLRHRAASA